MTVIYSINTRRCIGIMLWAIGTSLLIAQRTELFGHTMPYLLKMAIAFVTVYCGSVWMQDIEDFNQSLSLQMTAVGIFFLSMTDKSFTQFALNICGTVPDMLEHQILQTIVGTAMLICAAALGSLRRAVYLTSEEMETKKNKP